MWWSVVDLGSGGPAGTSRLAVYRGGDRLFRCDGPEALVPLLLWWVNRVVCFETRHRLMVHAGVAALGGRGLLLPAPQESGKTTLVAGLVEAGFGYLSDEAAALDPASGAVEAYPKWLSVEAGSWPLFPRLRPELPPELARFATTQWHVDPGAVRPDSVVATAQPAWLIAPRYEPGAATSLVAIGRPEGLAILAGEAFNLRPLGRAGFDALTRVIHGCRCWRLTTGDLAEAVDAVRSVTL